MIWNALTFVPFRPKHNEQSRLWAVIAFGCIAFCILFILPRGVHANVGFAGERRPATLPVVTTAMKQKNAVTAQKKASIEKKSGHKKAVKQRSGRSLQKEPGAPAPGGKNVEKKRDPIKHSDRKPRKAEFCKELPVKSGSLQDNAGKPLEKKKPLNDAGNAAERTPAASKPLAPGKKISNTAQALARRQTPVSPPGGWINKKNMGSLPRGLNGFSSDPFALKSRDSIFFQTGQNPADALAGRKRTLTMSERRLSVSSKTQGAPENRLTLQRTAFSGGYHTLPYMDSKPSTEVSMAYKVTEKARTRVIANPQDENSPLYRPVEKDSRLNAGGAYVDLDVRKDLQLQMGGEYSEVDSSRLDGTQNAQGASVGLRWNF